MRIVSGVTGPMLAPAPEELSPEATAPSGIKLAPLAHGQNVSLTARHFGISRQTFYPLVEALPGQRLSTWRDTPSQAKRRQRPAADNRRVTPSVSGCAEAVFPAETAVRGGISPLGLRGGTHRTARSPGSQLRRSLRSIAPTQRAAWWLRSYAVRSFRDTCLLGPGRPGAGMRTSTPGGASAALPVASPPDGNHRCRHLGLGNQLEQRQPACSPRCARASLSPAARWRSRQYPRRD